MGVGAASGSLAAAAGASAGMHAVSERRAASDSDLATKIGNGLAQQIGEFAVQQNWIPATAVQ
jgi:hypothetical protein